MSFLPLIEGSCPIRSTAGDFCARMEDRVERGLLDGRTRRRANYAVARAGAELRIRARDWSTALAVGLNELELLFTAGAVHYRVRYRRWAAYCIALSASIGLVGLGLLAFADVRSYIAEHPAGTIPGLSIEQNVLVAWGMFLFWGFVWPWVLIHLHQRPLRRLVERLIAEVDAAEPALRA